MPCPDCASRTVDRLAAIVDAHQRDATRLIGVLQAVQHEFGWLSQHALSFVATALGLPLARVVGVATFYSHFALKPKGRVVVRVCDGTACHVRGSTKLIEALHTRFDLSHAQTTASDLSLTVETVSCIGACGLAPVLMIDEAVHGQITAEQAVALVEAAVGSPTDAELATAT